MPDTDTADAKKVAVLGPPFEVGEKLPMRMNARDMCRLFRIKHAQFYKLVALGTYDQFEILPKIGPRAWSGVLITRYLQRQTEPDRIFGRKRLG